MIGYMAWLQTFGTTLGSSMIVLHYVIWPVFVFTFSFSPVCTSVRNLKSLQGILNPSCCVASFRGGAVVKLPMLSSCRTSPKLSAGEKGGVFQPLPSDLLTKVTYPLKRSLTTPI